MAAAALLRQTVAREFICPRHAVTMSAPEPPVCWLDGCGMVMERAWLPNLGAGYDPHPANVGFINAQVASFEAPEVAKEN